MFKQGLHDEVTWATELKGAIRSVSDLEKYLQIKIPKELHEVRFPILVTKYFASKMSKSLDDPLLKQVLKKTPFLKTDEELEEPLLENQYKLHDVILKKYAHRILCLTTSQCAIHCQYCFRQNHDYPLKSKLREFFKTPPTWWNQNEIKEVILSGGDPLTLTNSFIKEVLEGFAALSSAHTLRIHTRVPIVLPSRVTDEWLSLFDDKRWKLVMVVHANHPNELEGKLIKSTFKKLSQKFTLLNQSVLLKGINNQESTLKELSWKLHELGVMPYYLHQLDKVSGGAEYEVPETVGSKLVESMAAELPGYLVPRYVREIPGKKNKTPIFNG